MKFFSILILSFFLLGGCANTEHNNSSLKVDENIDAGIVLLQFDITELGDTSNIIVIESSHGGLFNKKAIEDLSKWKYKPKIVDGKPIKQVGLTVQLEYYL